MKLIIKCTASLLRCTRLSPALKINKRLFIPMATNTLIQQTLRVHRVIYADNSKLSTEIDTSSAPLVDSSTYERVCEDTLDSLCEYFEELIDSSPHLSSADVNYGGGVLTVNFGDPFGTYVINRQSPNRQIWLSSPTSGPKRYDFVLDGNYWVYKHDGRSLHELLQNEIPAITKSNVDFSKCSYSRL